MKPFHLFPLFAVLLTGIPSAHAGLESLLGIRPILVAELEKDADKALSDQVRAALKGDAALATASKDVTVASAEGTVILRGFVQSGQDKNDVLLRVRRVPGVLYVNDQIQVRMNKY